MESNQRKPLRLWPGIIGAVLLVVLRFVVPIVLYDTALLSLLGALVCALVIVIWWFFFSRAAWIERLGALVVALTAYFAVRPFVDVSITTAAQGMMLPIFAIFVVPPALVVWAVVTRRMSDGVRRVSMIATILLATAAFTLIRTGGMKGEGSELAWRWTKTAEERLLAREPDERVELATAKPATSPSIPVEATTPPPAPAVAETPKAIPLDSARGRPADVPPLPVPKRKDPEWPGFRGRDRNGVVRDVRINTDWTASPPVQLWRRSIGPGWSSFAVDGDLLYTQEQRGEDEIVACYRISTGAPVWRHRDKVRFWESNGGAGPRATPTLAYGRVYAFGATGILNALDAATGAVVWSRNVASDSEKKVPMWGFSSSPLVLDDMVVVAASGKLAAYDITTGKPRWFGPARPGSYSSPQLATIGGVPQILMLTAAGATSVAPGDGSLLWEHKWPEGTPIVQPALTADGDVLVNSLTGTGGLGIRRIAVTRGVNGWAVNERWTSTGLKPYFNDFVIHNGHAYGFDGSILSCINLDNGERKWKGGRYGSGQLVLLRDQDLLLVVSEDGELALVNATPDGFAEVARFKAIEGKTWNHPVVVGDVLLVRNGEQMAAFKLSLDGR